MSYKRLSFLVLCILMQTWAAQSLPLINNSTMPVKYFTGREFEIKEIEKRFFKKNQRIVTLVGIGGIGKTQIIRKFIQDNRNKYDIIWEVDCASNIPRQLKELGLAINEKFGVQVKITGDDESSIKNIWKVLNSKRFKYLLVFDNLQISQNQLLESILPEKILGHILIATRDQERAINFFKINMLDEKSSSELINRLNLNKNLDTLNIYRDTSGHPLSIYKYLSFSNANQYMTDSEIKKYFFNEQVTYDLNGYVKNIITKLNHQELGSLIKITMLINRDISKDNFLLLCTSNQDIRNLYALMRFVLLDEKTNYKNKTGFEMHDILKSQLQAIIPSNIKKEQFCELIDNVNKLFDKSYPTYDKVLSTQTNLLSHCEQILKNIEVHNIEEDKQLEFRSHLTFFYLYYNEYEQALIQANWFNDYINRHDINSIANEHTLNIIANFYKLLGIYEHCYTSDRALACKKLERALAILASLKNPDVNVEHNARLQLAQALLYSGDIASAKIQLEGLSKLFAVGNTIQKGSFYNFLRAKLFLEEGEYQLAMNSIENAISADTATHSIGLIMAPDYALKADILERMGKVGDSIKFARKAYFLVKKDQRRETELLARVLISLARCEKSLKRVKQAKAHIRKAKQILQDDRKYKSIQEASDCDLADILYIEGELAYLEQDNKKAIELLMLADTVYSNDFSGKPRMDKIKRLYQLIIDVAGRSKNNFIEKMYSKKLEVIQD